MVPQRQAGRSAEEHRGASFIAFGGPQGLAGLSPGTQAESMPHVGEA